MTITDVRIVLPEPGTVEEGSRLLAYVSLVLDEVLVLRDLKLIQGRERPFLSFPSRKVFVRCSCGRKLWCRLHRCICGADLSGDESTGYADIVFPISQHVRDVFEQAILNEYRKFVPAFS